MYGSYVGHWKIVVYSSTLKNLCLLVLAECWHTSLWNNQWSQIIMRRNRKWGNPGGHLDGVEPSLEIFSYFND
jgi:hypothetical protein